MTFSNFHTTALCSPTRASLLTGRNATTNGMATIAEFASGFPGISTRIPFENGFISEVLAEHGYNTYCVGKWHLTPGEECNLAAYKGRWPLGRGFERFYGWLGGETNSYFPDLVHDNHPIEPPARPEDGYHLADDLADKAVEFIQDAKVIDPDKPFFMYLAPQAGHAPHLVPLEWADRYKGVFDEGYEAIRAGHPGPPDRARPAARGHRAVADQPPRRARSHRPRRPALAAARHGAPVGLARRRRAAAVRPHGRGLRRLHLLLRRPARPGARLPRGVRASSTTRSSSSSPTTAPAARAAPTAASTSGASSTACPTPSRPPSPTSTSSARRRRTTTTTPAGPGRSTPRSPTGSAGPAPRVASPTCASCPGRRRSRPRTRSATSTSTPSTSCPTIYDLLGHRAARGAQGLPAEPDRGRELRRRAHRPDRARASGRSSTRCSASARSTTRAGWPAPCTRRCRAGATSSKDEWELFHLETDRSQSDQRRGRPPRAARAAQGPVVLLRRHLQRTARRRPQRARAGAGRTAPRRARPRPVRLLPGLRRRARVGRPAAPGPLVHDRRRGRRSTRPTSRA